MSDNKTEIREIKTAILKRKSPGDQWMSITYPSDTIFQSLIDALEYHYQKSGQTEFFISARRGIVEVVEQTEVQIEEAPIKRYSIYEED